MKFLVDHQLPPVLAGFLQSQGHTAQHVRELGLKKADDLVIWLHAAADNAVKLLWVRIGNCRTKALLENFKIQLPRAIAAFESGSLIVEIR